MEAVYIVDARRSPIGRLGGVLSGVSPVELGRQVGAAMLPGELPAAVEQVIVGQALPAGQGMNSARQIALALDIPQQMPSFTVNMVCGSSLKAVALAADAIRLGDAGCVLAGGVECMSQAPFYVSDLRRGRKLGNSQLLDAILTDGLTDPTLNMAMGETAERIAARYGISRDEQDQFAAISQQRAALAATALQREIVPIAGVDSDEHPRPDTTLEALAKLRPAFRKDGSVTAGNASGINDGAALVLLAGESALSRHNLTPRARIIASAAVGCDPALMGLGPVGAIRAVLKRSGWSVDSVDCFEINEAFAAQVLGCNRELEIDLEKLNPRGGAIALGHPIGASGARVLTTLLHALEDTSTQRGVASLCIGGGMGIAIAIERVE